MGQAVKWLAAAVAVLVAVVVALALALDSDAISGRVKAVVVPRVSEALGRELTVADARLSIFPNPRVRLGGAQLAGRAGEPPLARLESLDVEIGLWPLVRSLGKEVRVHGLTLVRPEVNLVRGRDGRWNYEGLGGASAAPAEERAPPGEPVRFAVEKATLTDGTLRFIDLAQGRNDQAVALTKMDLTASGGPGAPVSLTFSAALAAAEKNLELSLDSPLLPEDLAEGGWPALTGRVALKGLQLAQLRGFFPADLAAIARGGTVDLSADVKSQGGGYRLAGKGAIEDLRLHGEPASGGFTLTGAARPAGPAHLAVTDLAVKGPGIELGGSAELQTEPIRARFAISGPLLDLGAVLGLAPADPAKKPEPLPKGTLLPPAMQEQVAAVAVDGTLDIQKVVNGKLTATDVKASAKLAKGVLTLEQATAKLYGGAVEASGTKVHLTETNPRWNLKARLDGVDLGGAMQAITGAAPLTGRLTGTIDLAGAGADWEHVKRALTGRGALALAGGALTTTDLGDAALAAVSKALSRVGQAGAAEKLGGLEGGKTTLEDLAATFDVKDGFLALTRPLAFRSRAGEARLGGRVGLSQELALEGTLALSKELLARAGAGGLLSSGVDVPLRLGGTLGSPSVSVAAEEAVAGAARGAAKKVVAEKREQVEGEVKERVEEKARGILDRLGK
jgi:AsmA protein